MVGKWSVILEILFFNLLKFPEFNYFLKFLVFPGFPKFCEKNFGIERKDIFKFLEFQKYFFKHFKSTLIYIIATTDLIFVLTDVYFGILRKYYDLH
jgi:hypothetical protein